jgi:signal transduction histidine kinase
VRSLSRILQHRYLLRTLIIVPPILFLLYAGHSLLVIRQLLSRSTQFHLDYANSLVQEYLEKELSLELDRLQLCITRGIVTPDAEARGITCEDAGWLTEQTNGEPLFRLATLNQHTVPVFLNPDGLGQRFQSFFDDHAGLSGLFARAYHEPVYWCQILAPDESVLFRSSSLPSNTENKNTYPLTSLTEGYRVQIVYNSFGAKQLYSVAKQRINFGLIFLLFMMLLVSLLLFTRSIRQKLLLARQKTFFVTTVSHEFKTPLAIMKLASETLQSGRYKSAAEANRFHQMLQNEINRLNHLVHMILNFDKIETGQVAYHFREIDLVEVVQGTIEIFRIQAESDKINLVVELPDEPVITEGDPELIRHAIDNIVDNAFKYRGKSDRVEISLAVEDQYAVVRVRDYGVGIPAAEIDYITKSFYRAPTPQTLGIRGSGLGLSVSSHILDAARAQLDIESEVGTGSIFTIRFPMR